MCTYYVQHLRLSIVPATAGCSEQSRRLARSRQRLFIDPKGEVFHAHVLCAGFRESNCVPQIAIVIIPSKNC